MAFRIASRVSGGKAASDPFVASVGALAVDLAPVAILLLIVAICALAPLFSPALDA